MFKFITLSRLMSTSSLSGMNMIEMQTQLQTSLGQETIVHCRQVQLPARLKTLIGRQNPKSWMEELLTHHHQLRVRDINYFVLDTLQYLDKSDLGQVTPLLQQLSDCGMGVIAIDRCKTPLFFTALREILCTDSFMDIYLQSMWHESMTLKVTAQKQAPDRSAPPRFQFMSRIFVA